MEIVTQFLDWVLSLLPTSPFVRYINALADIPFLAYLNWFIPIPTFLAIGQAWLTAVATFYMFSIILRWIRAIE